MSADLPPGQLEMLRYLEDLQTNNPAEYEQMLQQLRLTQGAEQGAAASGSTTVVPTAGLVAKTRSITAKGRKVFINLCSSELIDECGAMDADAPLPDGAPPAAPDEVRIRIPLSVGPPREDLDGHGAACRVYDVVFHPATVESARSDREFRDFTMRVVSSQIQAKYADELEGEFSWPKLRGSYKGVSPLPQFIRAKRVAAPRPASEGGGFAGEPPVAPAARPAPIIEEVPQAAAAAARAAALLPAPAYVLRPLDADGRPIGGGEEGAADGEPDGGAADDAAARVPASLQLKVHLPLLAPSARRSAADAADAAAAAIEVSVSAWDVRVRVGELYCLQLELPHAVRVEPLDCAFEVERGVLLVALAVLGAADAAAASDDSAALALAAKANGEAWEAQLAKEARARKAKLLLQAKRREEALEQATAKAAADAAAAERAVAAARAAAAARPDGADEGGGAEGEAPSGARARPPPAIVLSNAVMFELE